MNCQEFWERMPRSPENLGELEAAHATECAECASAWERERLLAAGLHKLRADWRSLEAPARVEARLVKAFRAQHGEVWVMPARTMWMPLASGIAAALIAATALLLVPGRPTGTARRPHVAIVEVASLAGPIDDNTPDSDGFIPLPNAERIAPDENVNVVRVEVPRSAMLAVGLTVTAEQSSELVEADIKMGSNGLARAVRFVTE